MSTKKTDTSAVPLPQAGLPDSLKSTGGLDQLAASPADVMESCAAIFRARARNYGDYTQAMMVFAGLVSDRLRFDVTPAQAAGIMSDLKQSRLLHDPGHAGSARDKIVYEAMALSLRLAEGGSNVT